MGPPAGTGRSAGGPVGHVSTWGQGQHSGPTPARQARQPGQAMSLPAQAPPVLTRGGQLDQRGAGRHRIVKQDERKVVAMAGVAVKAWVHQGPRALPQLVGAALGFVAAQADLQAGGEMEWGEGWWWWWWCVWGGVCARRMCVRVWGEGGQGVDKHRAALPESVRSTPRRAWRLRSCCFPFPQAQPLAPPPRAHLGECVDKVPPVAIAAHQALQQQRWSAGKDERAQHWWRPNRLHAVAAAGAALAAPTGGSWPAGLPSAAGQAGSRGLP